MDMKTLIRRAVAAALVACTFGSVATMQTANAAGPGLFHYSVHTNDVVEFSITADESPCGQAAVITNQRQLSVSMATTVAGLSDATVLSLANNDPAGIVRQIAMLGNGGITIEMGAHTFVGNFMQRFDGRFLTNGMYLQSGSLAVTARSEIGTLFTLHHMGNDVDGFDGLTKRFFYRGKVVGCLS